MKNIPKSVLWIALAFCIGLCGCQFPTGNRQYSATYLTVFDTVTTIVGTADSQTAFDETAQQIYDSLLYYHRLFDIYHEYDGISNLKTVNDAAGKAAVKVDESIIRLLLDCKQYYALTDGRVNVAIGSVTALWTDARNAALEDPAYATLPDETALQQASAHTNLSCVLIDQEASTIYISDSELSLDVGAIAKGWATQQVAQSAPSGLLISVGGNVCATGPKDAAGTPWVVGVQNPNGGSEYLHTLNISGGSVVTSGDYQRTYTVDGKAYHHIIDPDTLYPGRIWCSVTVICPDSGLADALSTALFLLPLDRGQKILEQCDAEAMWVDAQGEIYYSSGFSEWIRR